MFGLTVEKLFLVILLAALVFGPHRLPEAARALAQVLRRARGAIEAGRDRVIAETGLRQEDWRELDPRQYDPRRIVREALAAPDVPAVDAAADPATSAPIRWRIEGTSAHPRRVRVWETQPSSEARGPDPAPR